MIFEIGNNLYHLLIFLIVAWAIMRFLVAVTKIPVTPKQIQQPNKKEEERTGFTR